MASTVNGTPSDTDDKTTDFTYDGSGHMLTLKASLTSGYQETKWVYGTTTGASDDVVSNDLPKETRWPDTSTGAASSSEKDVVTVNALGETKTFTDRNGSVHTIMTATAIGCIATTRWTTISTNCITPTARVTVTTGSTR